MHAGCYQARNLGGVMRNKGHASPHQIRQLFRFEIIFSDLILFFSSQKHRGDGNGCCMQPVGRTVITSANVTLAARLIN